MSESSLPTGKNPERKSKDFLPKYFRTPSNNKFLSSTVDQVFQNGQVEKLNGFVGQRHAAARELEDNYIDTFGKDRNDYQLDVNLVKKDEVGNIQFSYDYLDYIGSLKSNNGNVDNHSKLNTQEFYAWNPHIDFDKFTNFREYYWLPNGPNALGIQGQSREVQSTYSVTTEDNDDNTAFVFSPNGFTQNPTLTLYRGQTYRFEVDTPGHPIAFVLNRTFVPGLEYGDESENVSTVYTDGVTITADDPDNSLPDQTFFTDAGYLEKGVIEFTVPDNAPDVLYYTSQYDINTSGVLRFENIRENSEINVENEILGKRAYTTRDGWQLTNGMKVYFVGNVTPAKYAEGNWYVEGVGDKINLVSEVNLEVPGIFTTDTQVGFSEESFDNLPFDEALSYAGTKDYIVMKRDSADRNSWARYNRWTHKDVIQTVANILNIDSELNEDQRAKRPIIEFDAGVKLYNHGWKAKTNVDLVDDFTVDVFSIIEGSIGYNVDNIQLAEGMRVLFTADTDNLVNGKIYEVSIIEHNNRSQISLKETDDSDPVEGETVLVNKGTSYAGKMFYFDGTTWKKAQDKTAVNQAPLFDMFDKDGYSLADETIYPATTFKGNKIFSYKEGNGANDAELGFPLRYQNIANIGDIVFENNITQETWNYTVVDQTFELSADTSFVKVYDYYGDKSVYQNGWVKANTKSKQPIIRFFLGNELVNNFPIDVFDKSGSVENLKVKVYLDNKLLFENTDYTIATRANNVKEIVLTEDMSFDSVLCFKVSGDANKNANGHYDTPINFVSNPLNNEINTFTLGEVNNHVSSIVETNEKFNGIYPGASNLRDIGDLKPFGRTFVQHSGPVNLPLYHFANRSANVVDAIEYAANEYSRFKNNFLSFANDSGFDGSVKKHVDYILQNIVTAKNENNPFYYSDMIPTNTGKTLSYIVQDTANPFFNVSEVFSLDELSLRAIYVYKNGVQLVHGIDYVFLAEGFVQIKSDISVKDTITLYEYSDTQGSMIPPTPTKLGLYPAYIPKKYKDNTYPTPTDVIQGHDGSIVIAYGDFRDDLLLEFEKRIYNNIKVKYDTSVFDIYDFVPGYYRNTATSIDDIDNVLIKDFSRWVSNAGYPNTDGIGSVVQGNTFTYNFYGSRDKYNNKLNGFWRNVYKNAYDTDRPHTMPWEMLGFSQEPTWWEDQYGPAPYTRENAILWEDLEKGVIREPGKPVQRNKKFVRPNLSKTPPVDSNGNLISPLQSGFAVEFSFQTSKRFFGFGDQHVTETAWRRSSNYPFALLKALVVLQPAQVMGLTYDRSRTIRDAAGNIVYTPTNKRLRLKDVKVPYSLENGKPVLTSGLIDYVFSYMASDVNSKIVNYVDDLENANNNIGFKLGGYADKENLKIVLDSRTPLNKGNVFVPQENYQIFFKESAIIDSVAYSGVVIEKTTGGYRINGYDTQRPYFNVSRPITSFSDPTVNVGGISESFVDWATNKTYVSGKVVRYENVYYRTNANHVSTDSFDETKFSPLKTLPISGGKSARFTKSFYNTSYKLEYNTILEDSQAVVDFLLGYGHWLESQGFVFDYFNSDFESLENWSLAAKEFLFWTAQNWQKGTLLTISPAANILRFAKENYVVSDVNSGRSSILNAEGRKIAAAFTNIERSSANDFAVLPQNTNDGIFFCNIDLVQKEHAVVIDNTTVFNDIIYDAEPGFKQNRLKVVGYRTQWNGSFNVPGFVYEDGAYTIWSTFTDYLIGDVVKQNQNYYVAKRTHTSDSSFSADNWQLLNNKPITKLLPNLDYKSAQFEDFYDLDSDNFDSEQQRLAQHLIGYQKRDYLANIIQDEISQYKFYQGFIQDKGTKNVLTKLFDKLGTNTGESLDFYEEWALRLGQYGAVDSFNEVEYKLDEEKFQITPQPIELVNSVDNTRTDLIYQYPRGEVYSQPDNYNHAPFPLASTQKEYTKTAGYVRNDQIDYIVKTKNDILSLDTNLVDIGSKIWITKDRQSWNVVNVAKVNNYVERVEKTDTGMNVIFQNPVDFATGDIIGFYNISDEINGFKTVTSIASNEVSFNLVTPLETNDIDLSDSTLGTVVSLDTVKFDNVYTANDYLFEKDVLVGDKVWIDNVDSKWNVIQKSNVFNNQVQLTGTTTDEDTGFGKSISANQSNTILAAGNPDTGTYGKVSIYNRYGTAGNWTKIQDLEPTNAYHDANAKFGQNVNVTEAGDWLFVGVPNASNVITQFKGTLDVAASYVAGDIVTDRGVFWRAKVAVNGDLSTLNNFNQDWEPVNAIFADMDGTSSGLTNQGCVYVYKKNTDNARYEFINAFVSPDPTANENFGRKIEARRNRDGKTIVFIHSLKDNGRIYVFDNTENSQSFGFARDRTFKGTYSDVAKYYTNDIVYYEGVLYKALTNVFSVAFDSNSWSQLDTYVDYLGYFPASDLLTDDSDNLGVASGTLVGYNFDVDRYADVVILSGKTSQAGFSVSVYRLENNRYTYYQTLSLEDSSEGYAYDLAINTAGDTVIISSPLADVQGIDTGRVYVYQNTTNGFELTQSVYPPLGDLNELFGYSVAFLKDKFAVFSYNGDQDLITEFDKHSLLKAGSSAYLLDKESALSGEETTFDGASTRFTSQIKDAGQIYVFEKLGNDYIYAEKVQSNDSNSFALNPYLYGKENILYAAYPANRVDGGYFGRVREYQSNGSNSWNVLAAQGNIIDLEKIKSVFLYDTVTADIITYLDYIDPIQGKIAGPAEQELSWKLPFDPAQYNVGTSNTGSSSPWDDAYEGKLWWDLSATKWYNPYQGNTEYKSNTWNTLVPGFDVDIYEWISSDLLPSEWDEIADTTEGLAQGISGTSKYGDNRYAQYPVYDAEAQTFTTKYFYWVKNKKILPNNDVRKITAESVANLIKDPAATGYRYVEIIDNNKFVLNNCDSLISGKNTVLHFDYYKNSVTDQNIHTEYQIVSDGLATSVPNNKLVNKMIDSLVGYDSNNSLVPDPNLGISKRYGIQNTPRQGMFVNKIEATKQIVDRINLVLAKNLVVDDFDISDLETKDDMPTIKSARYDTSVSTNDLLQFVGVAKVKRCILNPVIQNGRIVDVEIADSGRGYNKDVAPKVDIEGTGEGAQIKLTVNNLGQVTSAVVEKEGKNYSDSTQLVVRKFSVLVENDTTLNGKWAIYSYDSAAGYVRTANQTFNTSDYWSYIDWYATGYNAVTAIDFTIEASYQLDTIDTVIGDIVKINNIGSGGWLLLEKIDDQENVDYTVNYKTIGRQNGTIELSANLYNRPNSGFDISGYDSNFFDKEPTTELRVILETVRDKIFVDNLAVEWNKLFFVAVRYALYEQTNVDWVFKTSFVKAKHNVGELEQKITYQNDNLENYQDYVNEVKPYSAKIREYISAYEKVDPTNTAVTDFDSPPYYDTDKKAIVTETAKFRNNAVTNVSNIVNQYPQKYWYDNTKFEITDVVIFNAGSNYTQPATVTISGGNGPTLTGTAYLTNGAVSKIDIDTTGARYTNTPTVEINGSIAEGGSAAKAYAYIGNSPVKNIHMVMKFDRTSGVYKFLDIQKTVTGETDSNYVGTGSKTEFGLEWPMALENNNIFVSVDGIEALSSEYVASNKLDTTKGYDRYQGLIKFTQAPKLGAVIRIEYKLAASYLSAEDRIYSYYEPTTGMFGKDLSQLMKGVDYDGVLIDSIDFSNEQGFDVAGYGDIFDTFDTTYDDEAFTLDGSSTSVTVSSAFETSVVYNVYLNNVRIDDPQYDGSSVTANPNAQMASITGDGTSTTVDLTDVEFDDGDVLIVRRSTSDGSFTPNAEAFDTTLTGGDLSYSTATGIDAGEIVVDGDGFVTPTTSGGPEELVPGQLNDTLDLKVYSKVSDGQSMITVNQYMLDGSTTVFDISSLPQSQETVVVKVNSQPISSQFYTVDYANKTLTLDSSYVQPNDAKLAIFVIGNNGNNIIEVDQFTADGTRKEFITSAKYVQEHKIIVTINGTLQTIGEDVTIFETDSTYDDSKRFALRFPVAPAADAIVTYSIYGSDEVTYSQVVIDRSFVGDGVKNVFEFDEDNLPFNLKPYTHNMLVRVKDKFLKAGYNIQHTVTSERVYSIEAWQFAEPTQISLDEVLVLLNGSILSTDKYSWDPVNSRIQLLDDAVGVAGDIINIYILATGDYYFLDTQVQLSGVEGYTIEKGMEIQFALRDDSTVVNAVVQSVSAVAGMSADTKLITLNGFIKDLKELYLMDSSPAAITIDNDSTINDAVISQVSFVESNNLTFKRTPAEFEQVELYLFSNHDINKFDRISFDVTYQAAGLLEGSTDYVTRNLLTRGYIKLNTTAIDAAYVWVIKNGILLTPNADYILVNTLDAIQLNTYPERGDTIEVFHFANKVSRPKYGFRIFKDMLDRTHYKRINNENTYTLATPLNYYDSKITLVDATGIIEPNRLNGVPGVVFIDNERIEYYQKQGNTLRQLRRGTLGTGTKTIYATGTEVVGQGIDETIPYKDEVSTTKLIGDGSTNATAYALDFIPNNVNEIDVFVAGKRMRKTSVEQFNYTLAQDSTDGDETLPAEFTIAYNRDPETNAITTADVVFTTPPADGVTIEIKRRTGKLWNDIVSSTETKTLAETNNKIARFITSATIRLAK
jgi:hypothetical protein